jgi:hypothetical protein
VETVLERRLFGTPFVSPDVFASWGLHPTGLLDLGVTNRILPERKDDFARLFFLLCLFLQCRICNIRLNGKYAYWLGG